MKGTHHDEDSNGMKTSIAFTYMVVVIEVVMEVVVELNKNQSVIPMPLEKMNHWKTCQSMNGGKAFNTHLFKRNNL